jgi:hypothetical protein
MQILIDTETETPDGLLNAAKVLLMLAGNSVGEEIEAAARPTPKPAKAPPAAPPIGPAPTETPAPAPLPPSHPAPPAPVEHPEFHPEGKPHELGTPEEVPAGTEIDPAQVFGGAGVQNSQPSAFVGTAVPPSTPPVILGELDSQHLPWDARIHSETRKKNADGSWRLRRNLDEGVKKTVLEELRAVHAGFPSQPAATVTSPLPLSQPAPAVPVQSLATNPVPAAPPPPTGAVSAPAPPPPVSLQQPAPPAAPPPMQLQTEPVLGMSNGADAGVLPPVTSFRDLMLKVNGALSNNRLTQGELTEACKAAGVDSITQLAAQPALVPAVDAKVNVYLIRKNAA